MNNHTRIEKKLPHVVIIGGGFGGLWAARTLARKPVKVTLMDKNNYHGFLPLLYQVSAAEIEPEQIAYPMRSFLRAMPNVSFDLARVIKIDSGNRTVICEDHRVEYDYLILATGSITGFFNIPGADQYSFPLKTISEGVVLRNHILSRFEHSIHESDEKLLAQRLTFVIVGGGPTGVEFSGALVELIKGPLKKDFPEIDFNQVKVYLLEGKNNLLNMFPPSLQEYTLKRLQKKGVKVRLGSPVERVEKDCIYLKSGELICTETIVWTAGVMGNAPDDFLPFPLTRDKRVEVEKNLQVPGCDNVYVIGDLSCFKQEGLVLPMVAPVAMEQGIHAAKNVLYQVQGKAPQPFYYQDKGIMVVIGRSGGAAALGKMKFTGFLAWLVWLLVHLMKLVGFRNRLLVLINWSWAYFLFEYSVRAILPSESECQILLECRGGCK